MLLIPLNDGKTESNSEKKENISYNSVVKLSIIKSASKRSISSVTATGFSIKFDEERVTSLILTNNHFCEVLDDDAILLVEDWNYNIVNINDKDIDYKIISSDPGYDLCALEVAGYIKPASLLSGVNSPSIMDECFVIGAPGGNFPIILRGYISNFIDSNKLESFMLKEIKNKFLLISLKISRGHSGSPVFNLEGDVVGIIFASFDTYGGIAISHNDIYNFLYKNNILIY
jgi:S1-C subfamily serine protease